VCRAEAYQQLKKVNTLMVLYYIFYNATFKLKKALLDYARASHIQPDEPSYLLYKVINQLNIHTYIYLDFYIMLVGLHAIINE